MAYDVSKLTKLADLKALAEKVKSDYATKAALKTVSDDVDALKKVGAEANKIETVKVNGVALPISEKAVDVSVPAYSITKDEAAGDYAAVYHLTKDGANEGVAINIPKDMVVSSGSVVTNPKDHPAGTYLKLVLANADADEIYIPVDSLIEYVTSGSAVGDMVMVAIDPTTHKVTASITDGTITKAKLAADIQATLGDVANKVDKEDGKGLSTNDYTTEEKEKLDGIAAGATKVEAGTTPGTIKVNGTAVTVVNIATDEEVKEMLTEVFTA